MLLNVTPSFSVVSWTFSIFGLTEISLTHTHKRVEHRKHCRKMSRMSNEQVCGLTKAQVSYRSVLLGVWECVGGFLQWDSGLANQIMSVLPGDFMYLLAGCLNVCTILMHTSSNIVSQICFGCVCVMWVAQRLRCSHLCSRAFSKKKPQRVFLITAGGRGTPVDLLISTVVTLAYIQQRDRHTREKHSPNTRMLTKVGRKYLL